MVTRKGRNAWSASRPMPTTGKSASSAASRESSRPTDPKSMPWLLAMVATSTPAAFSAWKALAGARNVKLLLCGVPRVVIAVSRLTMARSARRSIEAIGPTAVAGLLVSRLRMTPSKWTSPPNASVTADPLASPGLATAERRALVVGGLVVVGSPSACVGVGVPELGCWIVHAPSTAASTTASSVAMGRRADEDERDTAAPRMWGREATGADSLPRWLPRCQLRAQIVSKSSNRRDGRAPTTPASRQPAGRGRITRQSAGGAGTRVAPRLLTGGPGRTDDRADELVCRPSDDRQSERDRPTPVVPAAAGARPAAMTGLRGTPIHLCLPAHLLDPLLCDLVRRVVEPHVPLLFAC